MVESEQTSSEQPENGNGLRKFRETVQDFFSGRDTSHLTYGDTQLIRESAAVGPVERYYFEIWKSFAQTHPDMTFDEFMGYVERIQRRRGKMPLPKKQPFAPKRPSQKTAEQPQESPPQQTVEQQRRTWWEKIQSLFGKKK